MYKLALSALSLLAVCGSANAFEFRCRFVERVANQDIVINGNQVAVTPGVTRNIRIQFGVFDNASGPAPAGGFVGWNLGSLTVSGEHNNSTQQRNPGRMAPFTFSPHPNANGNPPAPEGDPFTMLTEIDATLGTQSPAWVCDAQGQAPPQPGARMRGVNTYVSVYAFSLETGDVTYSLIASGNLTGASAWQAVGTPLAPDCGDPLDPSDDVAGSVTYAPMPTAPRAFSCILEVVAPSPGTGATFGIVVLITAARRRRA